MYKKVSTDMNFVGREKEVEAFWKEHDIFQKSMEEKDCLLYTSLSLHPDHLQSYKLK